MPVRSPGHPRRWSHPGPAFFYLALPIYELFHERGPALSLFAFIANLACVLALTREAHRLRGAVFALGVALLLAVYECADQTHIGFVPVVSSLCAIALKADPPGARRR